MKKSASATLDSLLQESEEIIITDGKTPKYALLPIKGYRRLMADLEAMQETLEVLSDDDAVKAILSHQKDRKNPKRVKISLSDVKKNLL